MTNPASFLQHLRDEGYHPRSDKHSNSLAQAIVDDLIRHCPAIRDRALRGEIVYSLNWTLRAGTADWNVDLVLGPPPLEARDPKSSAAIERASPSTVQIAIEIKAVMTEHRKAVKNRKRDLEAHHEHIHNYDNNAIAGGVLVINAAETFQSPLRPQITVHRDSAALVTHCVSELRAVSSRGGPKGYGLDAKCAIVVSVDNVDRPSAKFMALAPAPALGDPLHYDAFIRTVCDQYTRRF
jgi:hypothetical protein